MDSEFLLADCTLFHPHTEVGMLPDELLNKFCCEHGATFSSAVKLMQHFGMLSLEEGVQSTVKRLNYCRPLVRPIAHILPNVRHSKVSFGMGHWSIIWFDSIQGRFPGLCGV